MNFQNLVKNRIQEAVAKVESIVMIDESFKSDKSSAKNFFKTFGRNLNASQGRFEFNKKYMEWNFDNINEARAAVKQLNTLLGENSSYDVIMEGTDTVKFGWKNFSMLSRMDTASRKKIKESRSLKYIKYMTEAEEEEKTPKIKGVQDIEDSELDKLNTGDEPNADLPSPPEGADLEGLAGQTAPEDVNAAPADMPPVDGEMPPTDPNAAPADMGAGGPPPTVDAAPAPLDVTSAESLETFYQRIGTQFKASSGLNGSEMYYLKWVFANPDAAAAAEEYLKNLLTGNFKVKSDNDSIVKLYWW